MLLKKNVYNLVYSNHYGIIIHKPSTFWTSPFIRLGWITMFPEFENYYEQTESYHGRV